MSFTLVLLDDVHLVAAVAEKVVRPHALASYAPKQEPYTTIVFAPDPTESKPENEIKRGDSKDKLDVALT